MIIDDGTGSGKKAKVDDENRLHTSSVGETELEFEALIGNAYNVNTGLVTLTNAGVNNGVVYYKNTGDADMIIAEILIILGTSTGGTGDGTITVYRNPTTGTLISGAVAVESNVNRSFKSFNALEIDAYKGATSTTVTNGEVFGTTVRSGAAVINFTSSPILLGKGNSLAITYSPPSGNTSQSIRVATTIYIKTTSI